MDNLLNIGIRNQDSEKILIIKNIFKIVNKKIKDKKGYDYIIIIQGYELLKTQIDSEEEVKHFEDGQMKGLAVPDEKIILFNDSFFNINEFEQQSVFLHEIGHIANKLEKYLSDKSHNKAIEIYKEYLADKFILEIDDRLFKDVRVGFDIHNLRTEMEDYFKNLFCIIGRLKNYCKLYNYNDELIINEIKLLTNTIKVLYPNIESVLQDLDKFCNMYDSESKEELYKLSNKIIGDIKDLKIKNQD